MEAPESSRGRPPLGSFVVLTVLIWIARLRLPLPPAGVEVDEAWQQGLARGLVSGLRWGRDLWFTHGPLGAFPYGRYEPALFEWKLYGWELVFKGVLAGFFAALVLRAPRWIERLLLLAVIVLFNGGEDAYAISAVLAIVVVGLNAHERLRLAAFGLGVACLAVLSLTKFTWLVVAAPAVLVLALQAARSSRRLAAGVLAGYLAALATLWTAAGQSLGDAWSYVTSSLQLSSGYSSAMALTGSRVELDLAVAALGLTLAAAGLRFRRTRDARDRSLALVVGVGLFLAWKSAFARHGIEANRFFVPAALAPLVVFASGPRPSIGLPRIELAAGVLAFVAGGAGFFLALGNDPRSGHVTRPAERLQAVRSFLDARSLETELVIESARLSGQHSLPRIRAAVGDAPVDWLGSNQGKLFLNDMNWRPRPVFQSYAAYSPALMRANAAYFAGERAPRFVVLSSGRIDRRYPVSADASAVIEVLHRYEPVFWERGVLLLRLRPDRGPLPDAVPFQRTELAFGETVELQAEAQPGELLLLRLTFTPTWQGRVASLLLREPELFLHVLLSDGREKRVRLIRGAFEEGVPAAPVFLTASTWNGWYLGERPLSVRAVRVEGGPGSGPAFHDTVTLELERLPLEDVTGEGVPQLLTLPSFFPQPARIVSRKPVSRRRIGGRPSLIVHAPSKLTYELAPGSYRLRGSYGFAERNSTEHPSNAARFAAVLRSRAGDSHQNRVALERTLPWPADIEKAPVVAFDVPLELAPDAGESELVLITAPAASCTGEGAFWRDVTIERVETGTPR